jgi:hypothetical protein
LQPQVLGQICGKNKENSYFPTQGARLKGYDTPATMVRDIIRVFAVNLCSNADFSMMKRRKVQTVAKVLHFKKEKARKTTMLKSSSLNIRFVSTEANQSIHGCQIKRSRKALAKLSEVLLFMSFMSGKTNVKPKNKP